MVEFVVFVDKQHGVTNIHRSACGFIEMRGGFSDDDPPNSWYMWGFDTVSKAEYAARWTGFRVHHCRNCFRENNGTT